MRYQDHPTRRNFGQGIVTPLPRAFYSRDPVTVAKQLLNKIIMYRHMSARIVETEAYDGANDIASHAYKGETARNAVMFGPAGHLYVYFTYGMHYCANVVCRDEGSAAAVLIRAVEPLTGVAEMRHRRGDAKYSDRRLTNGPAKFCQAFGIDGGKNGADLVEVDNDIFLIDDGTRPPAKPIVGPRVGIRKGLDLLWRFQVPPL